MSEGPSSRQEHQPTETDFDVTDFDVIGAIVAVGTWIASNQVLLGSIGGQIATWFQGVTNIKQYANKTDQPVVVTEYKNYSRFKAISMPPNETVNGEIWIPWAKNSAELASQHMTIEVGGQLLAYVWQNPDHKRVYFNVAKEFGTGREVPGESTAGGDRGLIVAKDPQGKSGFAIIGPNQR